MLATKIYLSGIMILTTSTYIIKYFLYFKPSADDDFEMLISMVFTIIMPLLAVAFSRWDDGMDQLRSASAVIEGIVCDGSGVQLHGYIGTPTAGSAAAVRSICTCIIHIHIIQAIIRRSTYNFKTIQIIF